MHPRRPLHRPSKPQSWPSWRLTSDCKWTERPSQRPMSPHQRSLSPSGPNQVQTAICTSFVPADDDRPTCKRTPNGHSSDSRPVKTPMFSASQTAKSANCAIMDLHIRDSANCAIEPRRDRGRSSFLDRVWTRSSHRVGHRDQQNPNFFLPFQPQKAQIALSSETRQGSPGSKRDTTIQF